MIGRVWCWLTLGHDPDFDATPTSVAGGWLYYPCRKCGALVLPSVFS